MDALTYLKARQYLCDEYDCDNCPFTKEGLDCRDSYHVKPELDVALVAKWYNENYVYGFYQEDNNIIEVYTEDTMYIISKRTGCCGKIKVGECAYAGHIYTRCEHEQFKKQCSKIGNFRLKR